jgi:hypothetical protein
MQLKITPKILIILYFINLFLYSLFSLIDIEEITNIFWFLRIPILLILYLVSSKDKKVLYLVGLLLYQFASIFFHSGAPTEFIYGTLCSMLFKACLVVLTADMVTKNNYKAISMAFIPFFVIYLYIIEFVVFPLGDTYYIWILNALFTSFIGGVAIINYVNDSILKNYWLLISAILFIVQIGAFFINKFYVKNEGIYQMVILTYGISHYAFYKFMILNEEEESL